ncbi:MAG: hypothetical protein FD181_1799 [Prolixibacteraceae bacterium]|nr:MAG: hypothetical protein FD181_1799 [Prolixibacteraceae bacterium]
MLIGNVNGATYYSRGNLAPNLTTSWAVNTDGSGSQPGNFTTAGDIFIVQNGHSMAMSANWAVTGNVVINNGGTLTSGAYTLTISGTTTVGGGTSGALNITSATGTKSFYGLVTINTGATWNNSVNEAVTFRGGITNNGTFTAGTGIHTFDTNAQAVTETISIPNVTVTVITLTNNGNLTVGTALAGTGGLTNSATGVLNIGGTSAITTLTATAAGNTVNYTGAAQTAKVTTYSNLTLSGSGNKTFSTTPTVNGLLSLEGTAAVIVTTGVVTYGTNATLQYNKPAAYTATSEEWITTFAGTGGVIIRNTGAITTNSAKTLSAGVPLTINTGSQLITGATSTWTLSIGGTTTVSGTLTLANTGTKTFTGAVTINANGIWNNTGNSATSFAGGITHNGTTFNNGTGAAAFSANQSFSGASNMTFGGSVTPATGTTLINSNSGIVTVSSIALTGNFTQGSNTPTLALTGATPFSGTGTFNANTNANTVNYSGAAQPVKATTYYNLILSGSGDKTIASGTSITGNLSIAPTGNAKASVGNGLTINAGTMTIGDTGAINGFWGPTTATTVIYQDDTYFAATTGRINVSASSCITPSSPTTTNGQICVGLTATLSASGASSGLFFRWYDASSGGNLLKLSADYNDNTYTTSVLGATTNYWVSISSRGRCESSRILVTATFPAVSADDRNRAGTGTWIGHVFKRLDSSPGAPSDANAFTNYYGTITEPETFNESFVGTNSCLPLTATESARSIYTEYFATRFRMNSSKTGVYLADIGSDDGARLTVDGALIYNQWVERGYVTDAMVLFTLTGTSNLLLEYYESTGGNQVSFQNLVKVPNNLTSGTNQTICAATPGSQISANNAFTNSPISGNAAFTVTYQWQQATNIAGPWSDIPGATFQDFTPPGLTAGSHYFRRKLTVSRTNPGTISVSAIDYSDIATVTVNPLPATGEIIPN